MMEGDDRRTSVDGYGCGGDGGATGRFVSWLCAEIQPLKDGVGMIVMVDDMSEKNNKCMGSVVRAFAPCFLLCWFRKNA